MEFDKKPLILHMENLRKSQKRIMGNLNFLPLQFQYKKYYVLGLNQSTLIYCSADLASNSVCHQLIPTEHTHYILRNKHSHLLSPFYILSPMLSF